MFNLLSLAVLLGVVVCKGYEPINASQEDNITIEYDAPNVKLNIYKTNGSHLTYTIKKLDPVAAIINDVCATLKLDDCSDFKDQISHWFTGMWYTPSLPHATAEDFGSNRISVVKHFADNFQYSDYLEIGTYKNELFNQAREWFPNAVGVDPKEGGTLRMTSDAFFANNTAYFDIIFVDGLHEANQVFRDIHNALNWLKPGGVIIMHDSNPSSGDVEKGSIKGGEMRWLGDTWKAAVALRLRKDIEIVVVDVDYGVGVIRRRENKHPLPAEWVKFLDVNPISMLSYDLLGKNRHILHRMMTMADMRAWLNEEKTFDIKLEL